MDMMGMGTLMNVGANFNNLVASVNNSCSQSPITAEGNTFKFDQDSLQEAIEGMRQKLEALGVEVPESSYAQGQLIDMQGRVAKDVRGDNRMLDVSRIPQGTYLLRVVLADGYAVSLKIVKR